MILSTDNLLINKSGVIGERKIHNLNFPGKPQYCSVKSQNFLVEWEVKSQKSKVKSQKSEVKPPLYPPKGGIVRSQKSRVIQNPQPPILKLAYPNSIGISPVISQI